VIVLVHGGGFDARCWDLLLPHLAHDAVAVDLDAGHMAMISHPVELAAVLDRLVR
jgi:hypothetical protein